MLFYEVFNSNFKWLETCSKSNGLSNGLKLVLNPMVFQKLNYLKRFKNFNKIGQYPISVEMVRLEENYS